MVVRVSKPKFNLRNVLTESNYGRVPYHKMPPGSIIQVVDHKANNSPTKTGSDYETIEGCTFSIYPKFKSSQILVSWDFGTEHNGLINGLAFRVYRQIEHLDAADGTIESLLKSQDQYSYPTQTGWGAGAGGVNITYIDEPLTTAKVTYFLQWHVEGGGTYYINYNDGGVGAKNGIAAQAMEIRQ